MGKSRHDRWCEAVGAVREAVAALEDIQAEYVYWRDSRPESLQTGATWYRLEEICGLDLGTTGIDDIESVTPPRGGGRD